VLSIIFLLIALYIFAQIGGALSNSGYRGKAQMQLAEAKILVALLAKVAKSDGYVSESEAAMISEILDDLVRQMGAGGRERQALKLVYKLEKENLANVRELAEKYNQTYRPSPSRKTGLIYFFLNLAYVDRGFSAAERRTISQICDGLGIAEHIQSQIFATFERSFYGTYYENGGAQSDTAYDEYDGYSTRSGGYWDKYGGRSTGGYGSSSYGGGTGYGPPGDEARVSADNPVERIESYRGKRIFLVSGTEAFDVNEGFVLPTQREFAAALDRAGIQYERHEEPGGHFVRRERLQQDIDGVIAPLRKAG